MKITVFVGACIIALIFGAVSLGADDTEYQDQFSTVQDSTSLSSGFDIALRPFRYAAGLTSGLGKSFLGTGGTSEDSATNLAKQTQNPVADLISLPFQWNTYFETGPKAKTQNVLNIQPVIPFSLSDEWNFIARPIIPLIEMPPLMNNQNRNHGLGNIQFQGFFSPKEVGDWIWGFGPHLEFPTNSGPDNRFGSDNWSAGPAFVALQMKGPWVYGGLFSQLWSYYGDDPEVNTTFMQPFLNYNLKDGWSIGTAPMITANWSADSGQQWTVPIGGNIGKVFRIGNQPIKASIGFYHYIEAPRNGPDWQLQFTLSFLFPKKG